VQITGDSVTGKMGRAAEKMAHLLLRQRWVHFVATDAHNLSSRPPRLSEARALIARKYGEEYAEAISTTNPKAVFEGKPFEPSEEPLGLYEEFKDRSWWQRLLE
jgi:protein-tyrosine phosphatase